jgi:hypothetical protein
MAETPVVTNLEIVQAGMDAMALRQANWIDARVLGVATAETFQAPALARFVLFSATTDFYCKIAPASTAAAIPAADVTDGTAPELNPTMRYIAEQEFISLISPAASVVTMQFFR